MIRWMGGNTFQLWGMIINFAHGWRGNIGRDAAVFR